LPRSRGKGGDSPERGRAKKLVAVCGEEQKGEIQPPAFEKEKATGSRRCCVQNTQPSQKEKEKGGNLLQGKKKNGHRIAQKACIFLELEGSFFSEKRRKHLRSPAACKARPPFAWGKKRKKRGPLPVGEKTYRGPEVPVRYVFVPPKKKKRSPRSREWSSSRRTLGEEGSFPQDPPGQGGERKKKVRGGGAGVARLRAPNRRGGKRSLSSSGKEKKKNGAAVARRHRRSQKREGHLYEKESSGLILAGPFLTKRKGEKTHLRKGKHQLRSARGPAGFCKGGKNEPEQRAAPKQPDRVRNRREREKEERSFIYHEKGGDARELEQGERSRRPLDLERQREGKRRSSSYSFKKGRGLHVDRPSGGGDSVSAIRKKKKGGGNSSCGKAGGGEPGLPLRPRGKTWQHENLLQRRRGRRGGKEYRSFSALGKKGPSLSRFSSEKKKRGQRVVKK